jgi:hypothetical protein
VPTEAEIVRQGIAEGTRSEATRRRLAGAIELRAHPHGARLYVAGRRLHHGPLGAILAAGAWIARRPAIAAILLLYAATDARDFPFRDTDNHAPRWRRRGKR